MSGSVPAAKPKATPRIALRIGGQVIRGVVHADIRRRLTDVSGRFLVEIYDAAGAAATFGWNVPSLYAALVGNEVIEISLDGEVVLIGYGYEPRRRIDPDGIHFSIAGRDRTGDLADCAALPNGPAMFSGVDLLHVANVVCAPFGIPVRADTDVGAPFTRLVANPHDTALTFLEMAARQRSVLLTSDGIGGLLLTDGGATRAPEPLMVPGNVVTAEDGHDFSQRFSDFFVKGQTWAAPSGSAALDYAGTPAGAPDPGASPGAESEIFGRDILMTGHAIDPQVTRWRPTVRLTRSQAGMSSVQEQAEWGVRVTRGMAVERDYTVLDWRAGPFNELWKPNQLVGVVNPFDQIDGDQLIAGLRYLWGEQGARTDLHLVGPTAFDRIDEAGSRKRHTAFGTSRQSGKV